MVLKDPSGYCEDSRPKRERLEADKSEEAPGLRERGWCLHQGGSSQLGEAMGFWIGFWRGTGAVDAIMELEVDVSKKPDGLYILLMIKASSTVI